MPRSSPVASASSPSAARRTSWTPRSCSGISRGPATRSCPTGRRGSSSSTPAGSSTARRKSPSTRSSSRSSARSGARSTASSSRAAWCRSTAASSPREIPRWTTSSGSTSSRTRRRPPRAAVAAAVHRQAARDAALRRGRAARPLAPPRLRVPEGRRGLRQPVHVLHDPADAGLPAQPHDRVARRRGAGARGPGRSELVLISQDTTRYGEDLGMKREGPRAARRGAPRRDGVPLDPVPLRLPEDARRLGARAHGARAALRAVRRHAAPARLPDDPRGDAPRRRRRRPTCAMIARMRDARPGHRDPHDLHRRLSRRERGGFRRALRVRPRGRVRQPRRLHVLARARLGRRAAGGPGAGGGEGAPQGLPALAPAADRAAARRARSVGRTVEAIVEGPCEETEHLLEGRLRSQAPEIDGRLLINDTGGRDVAPGEIVRVRDHRGPRVRPRRTDRLTLRGSGSELCTSSAILSASSDLPRGGVVTIGNFDGVHRATAGSSRRSSRARAKPAAVRRHHVRAAPARGAASRPRAAADPDAAPEGGGDRGDRHRVRCSSCRSRGTSR